MKTVLYATVLLAVFGGLRLPGADPQQPTLAAPAVTPVETIVFLRHGEKPEKEIGQLNCQGLNRALALPRVLISKFGRPDYLFAPAATRLTRVGGGVGDNYLRPLATIEPTAIELGMPVNADFAYTDIDGLQAELTGQKYQNAMIFVAWEHIKLYEFARQILRSYGAAATPLPEWPNTDYDTIYVFHIARSSANSAPRATLDIQQEGLNKLSDNCPGPQ